MEGFLSRELTHEQQNSLLASEMCMLLLSPKDKPTNGYVILTSRELMITNNTLPPKSILKQLNLKNLISVSLGKERPLFLEKKYQDSSTHIEVIFEICISKKKHTSLLNSPFIQRAFSASKYSPRSRSPSTANSSETSLTDSPASSKRSISREIRHKSPNSSTNTELDEKVKVKLDIFTLRTDSRLLDYLLYAFQFTKINSLSFSDSEEPHLSLPQTSVESLFEEIKQELAGAEKLTDKFSICRELIYAAHHYTHIYTLFWKHFGIICKFVEEIRLYLTPQDTHCSTNNRADELEFVILLMTGVKNSMSYPCSVNVRVKSLNSHVSLVTSIIRIALTEPWQPEGLSKQALVEFEQLKIEYFTESFAVLTHLYEVSFQSSWIIGKSHSITPHAIACLIESNFKSFLKAFSLILHSFISMLRGEQFALSANTAATLSIYSFLKLIEFIHSSSRNIWIQILKTYSEELCDFFNPALFLSRFKTEQLIIHDILSLSHWLHSSVKLNI